MMTCLLIDSVTNAVTVSLPSLVAGCETNYANSIYEKGRVSVHGISVPCGAGRSVKSKNKQEL